MYRKFKNFNNYSEQFLQDIPTLAQGEVATFRMLNGSKNIDPDTNERDKNPVFFPKTRIPMRDRVYDKYQNKSIEIGVVREDDGDKPVSFHMFVPGMYEARFGGKFSLIGGRGNDSEVFQFLMVTNHNAKKENRDQSKEALFEYINIYEEAEKDAKIVDDMFIALQLVTEMKPTEIKDFAAAMGLSTTHDVKILHAAIKKYAMESPKEFNERIVAPETKIKSTISRAVEANIINYDPNTYKVHWVKSGIDFAQLNKQEGVDWRDVFVKWLQQSENGSKIESQLRGALRTSKGKEAES